MLLDGRQLFVFAGLLSQFEIERVTFSIRFDGDKILRAVRRLNLLQGHLTCTHGELIEQGLDIDLVREDAGPLAVLLGVFMLNGLNKFFIEA